MVNVLKAPTFMGPKPHSVFQWVWHQLSMTVLQTEHQCYWLHLHLSHGLTDSLMTSENLPVSQLEFFFLCTAAALSCDSPTSQSLTANLTVTMNGLWSTLISIHTWAYHSNNVASTNNDIVTQTIKSLGNHSIVTVELSSGFLSFLNFFFAW